MQLRTSERKRAKIKMALQGCSGSGKTYSSLLLAYGLTNDWTKIAVIDSENGSADLYAHLGSYNVLSLNQDFSPERYIEAIEVCEKAGIEVIIIDSISQAWDYLLDVHSQMPGNSFTAWGKITPRQNAFIQKILQSNCHIISTMRTKQDYVLSEKNGKMVPEKVGLKSQQRDGVDYEFTLVFDIDIKHYAIASKDRTGLFINSPEFKISAETGKRILNWCNSGVSLSNIKDAISKANDIEELRTILRNHPEYKDVLEPLAIARKEQLTNSINISKISPNGNGNKINPS